MITPVFSPNCTRLKRNSLRRSAWVPQTTFGPWRSSRHARRAWPQPTCDISLLEASRPEDVPNTHSIGIMNGSMEWSCRICRLRKVGFSQPKIGWFYSTLDPILGTCVGEMTFFEGQQLVSVFPGVWFHWFPKALEHGVLTLLLPLVRPLNSLYWISGKRNCLVCLPPARRYMCNTKWRLRWSREHRSHTSSRRPHLGERFWIKMISKERVYRSLPLRPGGAENCNISFFQCRVKNVILQYWLFTRKMSLQFFGPHGGKKMSIAHPGAIAIPRIFSASCSRIFQASKKPWKTAKLAPKIRCAWNQFPQDLPENAHFRDVPKTGRVGWKAMTNWEANSWRFVPAWVPVRSPGISGDGPTAKLRKIWPIWQYWPRSNSGTTGLRVRILFPMPSQRFTCYNWVGSVANQSSANVG